MSTIVHFQGQHFKSKKDFASYIEGRLNSFNQGRIHATWVSFMDALLDRHPDGAAKREKGVAGYHVRRDPMGNVHLSIVTPQEEYIPFSWRCCISGLKKSRSNSLTAAMRDAISEQVLMARVEAQCALCSSVGTEVDHVYPFHLIRDEFLATTDVPDGVVVDNPRGGVSLIGDHPFTKAWQFFHDIKAKYRMLCRECNNKSWREPI